MIIVAPPQSPMGEKQVVHTILVTWCSLARTGKSLIAHSICQASHASGIAMGSHYVVTFAADESARPHHLTADCAKSIRQECPMQRTLRNRLCYGIAHSFALTSTLQSKPVTLPNAFDRSQRVVGSVPNATLLLRHRALFHDTRTSTITPIAKITLHSKAERNINHFSSPSACCARMIWDDAPCCLDVSLPTMSLPV